MQFSPKVLFVPAFAVALGIFFALLALLYLPAFSQSQPCADDAAKFCKDAKGMQGRMQCLKEHQAELSPQCQARVQAMEARAKEAKEVRDACQSDVQQFCNDVSPGGGRIAQCLRQHKSQLSAACQAELAQARSSRRSNR